MRLALAYRLVSPYTHTLMVARRAEGDEAQDLPELHVVSQMLAAGWGGSGRVGGVDMCVSFNLADEVPGTSFELASPAPPLRRASKASAQPKHSMPPAARRKVEPSPVALIALLDSRCGGLLGRTRAPQTLEALRAVLPAEVLGWLEAMVQAGWAEEVVMAAFLSAVAESPVGAKLSRNARRVVLKAAADAKPAAVLVVHLRSSLAGMTDEEWGTFAAAPAPPGPVSGT